MAHPGRINYLLGEPTMEAVIHSEKQGQNYLAEKLRSIETFKIKDIYIHAKMIPSPNLRPIFFFSHLN